MKTFGGFPKSLIPFLLRNTTFMSINLRSEGWNPAVTGSGVVINSYFEAKYLETGVTANSSARTSTPIQKTFTSPHASSYSSATNWDLGEGFLSFCLGSLRLSEDTQLFIRVQLKGADAAGALADKGFGVYIDGNRKLWGESYGSVVGDVDLGVTYGLDVRHQIAIRFYPGVKIEWYVDGVLKGTQTTLTKIPSGTSPDNLLLLASVNNGATGGVLNYTSITNPTIWRALS